MSACLQHTSKSLSLAYILQVSMSVQNHLDIVLILEQGQYFVACHMVTQSSSAPTAVEWGGTGMLGQYFPVLATLRCYYGLQRSQIRKPAPMTHVQMNTECISMQKRISHTQKKSQCRKIFKYMFVLS